MSKERITKRYRHHAIYVRIITDMHFFSVNIIHRQNIIVHQIKNEGTTTCLDSAGIQSTKPIMYACFLESDNQVWYIDIHGQLYQDNLFMCVLEQKIILRGHNCPNEWAFKEVSMVKKLNFYHEK